MNKMIELEKIVSSFFTLPGLFILILLIIIIYLYRKASSRFIRIFSLFSLLLSYFLVTSFGTALLVIPLERMYLETGFQEKFGGDYPIVIMGGGIRYTEYGALPGLYTLQRLVKGLEIYEELEEPIVYTGGTAIGQTGISEAELAFKWLRKMGVEEEDIVIEKQARNTYENGVYIKKWLQDYQREREEEGFKVYLVTNALHMHRSVCVFEKLGVEVIPVSSGITVDHKMSWLSYLPNGEALYANMLAVHEWLGLSWYKIKGRI